jgi:valyl-tRNA synthetase
LRTANDEIAREVSTITRLLQANEVKLDAKFKSPPGTPVAVTNLGEIFLVAGAGDKGAERERLEKEIAKVEADLRAVEAKLKNKSFVDRAPAEVVEEHRQRQKNFSEQLSKLKAARTNLG